MIRHEGKKETKFKYTYTDIASLCKLSRNTVRKYAQRGLFDPNDFKSVFMFINSRIL